MPYTVLLNIQHLGKTLPGSEVLPNALCSSFLQSWFKILVYVCFLFAIFFVNYKGKASEKAYELVIHYAFFVLT